MSCPHNAFGQPACHITAHPDYPHEKFCASCKKRFTEPAAFGILPLIVVIIGFLIVSAIRSEQSQKPESTSVRSNPFQASVMYIPNKVVPSSNMRLKV